MSFDQFISALGHALRHSSLTRENWMLAVVKCASNDPLLEASLQKSKSTSDVPDAATAKVSLVDEEIKKLL